LSQSSIVTIGSSLFFICRFFIIIIIIFIFIFIFIFIIIIIIIIIFIIIIRKTELVNFGAQCRYGTGEVIECCYFPVALDIVGVSSCVARSNMATLEEIDP
jgi:hypothetical protein